MLFFSSSLKLKCQRCWHFNIYEQEKNSCSVKLSIKNFITSDPYLSLHCLRRPICPFMYSQTSMVQTPLEPLIHVRDRGSSSVMSVNHSARPGGIIGISL